MIDSDNTDEEKQCRTDSDPESSATSDRLSRRKLLRALGATGVVGTAGCSFPSDSPTEPGSDQSTETPASTEPETPTGGETTYEKKEPPIATPWTDEVGPDNARPEYPRPQLVREEWKNLNGVWEFAGAEEGDPPPVGEELSERILVPYPVESSLSGIKRHETWMWYRRTFSVPASWGIAGGSAQRLLLHFERVDWEAAVYVNGEEVTAHRGGYDHFVVDVTDYVTEEGPQELVVGVFDPTGLNTEPQGSQPKGRQGVGGGVTHLWKRSASGIWDTVWMEPVPETYVDGLDMTPDRTAETLQLTVETGNSADATVEATAIEDGDEVGRVSGAANQQLELPVPDLHLWSPDDPFLYDLEVRLLVDGTVVDTVESYFGMRSLGVREVTGTARPTLNGEIVYHVGTLDSGYWPDGVYAAPTDEAIETHLQYQKELGFNMVRMHSKLETRRWFYHADQVGLLVWQDVPNMDEELPDDGEEPHDEAAREQFKAEVEQMVTEHDTHPSMAIWTPFNEGWGFANHNTDYVAEVTELIDALDPERLVDANSGYNVGSNRDSGAGDVNDVHKYPGLITPDPEPGRFSALGEYTSESMHLPDHTFGRCNGTSNGEQFVDEYVETVEQLRQFAVSENLSASVYTATTDLRGVCNGHITYDRKVIKAAEAENGIERVRDAHQGLRRTAGLLEQADLAVEVPDAYDAGSGSSSPEPFELAATFTNPESVESAAGSTEDVALRLSNLSDDWTRTVETATEFDAVGDGESETVTWEITPETAEDAVELAVEATFQADGETQEFVVQRELREVQIAYWAFDGSNEDSVDGYTFSLESGAGYDADVAVEGTHSLRLDGGSGYALLSGFDESPAFLHEGFSQRTFSTWINPDSADGRQCIFNEGGTVNGFGVRIVDGTLEASVANGGAEASVTTSFERTDWVHVAAVFDEGVLRLYVNGQENAANSNVGYDVVPSHVAGAEIGGSTTTTVWDDGGGQFFGGNVDATGFFRRALAPEKIVALAEEY